MDVELNSRQVYDILISKGITHFHHANTVVTAKSFLTQRALLSRQKIEELDLQQTPQDSDEIDKKFNIYNYIFLDGIDLAQYFSRPNTYGPVLFKFTIDILLRIPTVRITKQNPLYWNDKLSLDKMYFTSCEEFNEKYKTGDKYQDGKSCFVFTCLDGLLPFEYGLSNILVDDPQLNTKEGSQVIEIIKHHLFDDIDSFKVQFPNVKIQKTQRFAHVYKNMDLKKLLKRFKRNHIK